MRCMWLESALSLAYIDIRNLILALAQNVSIRTSACCNMLPQGCSMLGNRFSPHALPRALNMGPAFFPTHASAALFHNCLHQVLPHTIRRAVLLAVLLGECSRLLFSMQHPLC